MAQLQKIMMVEDDPDIQVVASLALEAVGGFEVLVCSGGLEALERVESFAPDLVMLDVMMPGMDGPTVLKHLRERPTTAPNEVWSTDILRTYQWRKAFSI